MSEEDLRKRLHEDPEFVVSKRYNFSIQELEERYPDGCPNNVIAAVLMLDDEAAVEAAYTQIVAKLREKMGVKL